MVDQVDSIATELTLRYAQYVAGVDTVVKANSRFAKSIADLEKLGMEAPPQYADAAAKSATQGADAHEKAVARIKTARKSAADASKAADSEEVASAKAAADAKVAIEEQAQVRIRAMVDRSLAEQAASRQRSSAASLLGTTAEPGTRATVARQTEIMAGTRVGGAAEGEVAAEKEVNSALVEQTRLRAGLLAANKSEKAEIREQLVDLQTYNNLLRSGLSEEAAAIELDNIRVARGKALAEQQALAARASAGNAAVKFGEGAGIGRGGSLPFVAGIAAAAGAGIAAEAVTNATEYAKALSDVSKEAGLSTTALQVYQHAAIDAGAKSTDFDQALRQLSDNLGKARTGSQEQAKIFAALGVSIKGTASAGDLLPTLIDRISSISDQATRARVEVALFGESGAKLDGLLSGGNAKVNELAAALQRTGAVLSSSDIAKLDDVSKKLEQVKAQLSVDIASVVAGNADAIEGLASSFASLVGPITEVVTAYEKLLNSGFGKNLPLPSLPSLSGGPIGAGISIGEKAGNYLGGKIHGLISSPGEDLTKSLNQQFNDQRTAGDFSPVQSGKVNNALLSKLGAPKGPKGPNPNAALNEADERTKRFNDLMVRYQDEQLAAVAQQTSDEAERADQQRAKIQRDLVKDVGDGTPGSKGELQLQADIDARKKGADKEVIAARLAQAVAARKAVAVEQENVVNLQENLSSIRRDTDAQVARLSFTNQLLEDGQRATDTSAQRQKTQLDILANEEKIKELTAQEVLRRAAQGDPTITKEDINTANTTLANVPAETAARAGQIKDQTRSPGQVYADSLKTTSDTIQDSEVGVLKQFNSQLDQSITKALHLHGIFGDIVGDLIDMVVKQALIRPLADSLFPTTGASSGGGGIGSIFGSIAKALGIGGSGAAGASSGASFLSSGSLFDGPLGSDVAGFRASGGPVDAGKLYEVGEKGPELLRMGSSAGTVIPNNAVTAINPNMRVSAPQISGPIINQIIQYSGAVDIADKNYVNQMAVGLGTATKSAIAQGDQGTLNRTPTRLVKKQTLGS